MIRGRKRKPGNRHACGKRKRCETEREVMAVAIQARQRHYGVTAKQARDERLGTSLGRLAFRGEISDHQYQAGIAFAKLYHHHHIALGLPMPNPRSVSGLLINEGIFGSSPSEPVLEEIDRIKRRFSDATDALADCDREQRFGTARRPTLLAYRIICQDEDTTLWPGEDIGNLRIALNALIRVFRL